MMLIWTDIGIFSGSLLWAALLVKLMRSWLPAKGLLAVLIVAVVSAMVPFNGLLIGSYIFALTSYLSAATILLLMGFLFISVAGKRYTAFNALWTSDQQWTAITVFFVLSGLLLYPLAGGLTMFDPYRLGYAGAPLSVLLFGYLFCWALWCVLMRWYVLLVLILTAVLAYYFKLLPSSNLWDYLMDPLVVIYSLFTLIRRGWFKAFKRQPLN